ncbi:MAG: DUF2892 domain-containing protein [Caldilineaceae bacterium]|nr:DUF2892 domain-containing protein [Caldilineaceae bacterium]MCB9140194.1 DUF2892 domain-containing protein [Caldilineaceae bacterium]
MQPNMGIADRLIRVVIALVFVVVYFMGLLPGWLSLTLLILGLVFLATAIVGYCPLYWPFKFSTNRSTNS